MESKVYPIGGFAPGNYCCNCCKCGSFFNGDKRAVECEPCAISAKEKFDALSPDEQAEVMKRNIEEVNKLFSDWAKKPDINLAITGHGKPTLHHPGVEYQNLFDYLSNEHGLSLFQSEMSELIDMVHKFHPKAQPSAVWVKAGERFPIKKHVIAKKFISYLNKEVIGTASSATGEMICFDWGGSSICLAIGHEELNDLVWLDEAHNVYQENKERDKAVDFAMHINSAEQGSREDYESAYDHWNTSALREANNRDLDESAAGREEDIDVDELWDEHAEYIDDNIDDLTRWAGSTVITREQFNKMMAKFKQQKIKV